MLTFKSGGTRMKQFICWNILKSCHTLAFAFGGGCRLWLKWKYKGTAWSRPIRQFEAASHPAMGLTCTYSGHASEKSRKFRLRRLFCIFYQQLGWERGNYQVCTVLPFSHLCSAIRTSKMAYEGTWPSICQYIINFSIFLPQPLNLVFAEDAAEGSGFSSCLNLR